MPAIRKTSKFWIVYVAAWLPYGASFTALFLAQGGASTSKAVLGTLFNIGSAAVLGVGVLRVCERFPWGWRHHLPFFLAHIGFAVAYSVLWGCTVLALMTIEQSVIAGKWSPALITRPGFYWVLLMGLMFYGTIASVAYVLQVTSRLREEQTRAERAETLRTKAELKALRAQLNPHFLFNTLHSLMALVRHDSQAAEDALERFAEMLRYTLKAGREDKAVADDVSLNDEWNFVQNYLSLEKLRLGDRLQVEAHLAPDSLDCAVPAFVLQPLVENAIKHAIAPHVRGGVVTITSRLDGDEVVIEVRDDGPGTTRAALEASSGLGLQAVRQRLDLRYAGQSQFVIDTAPERGVTVTIRVPVESTLDGKRNVAEVR